MPLASGRETGSRSQWAPYQRPRSNTRPPHHQNSVGTSCVLRPTCASVGPCSIRSCLSWQTLMASLVGGWPYSYHTFWCVQNVEWQNLVWKLGPNSEILLEYFVPYPPIVAQTRIDREWRCYCGRLVGAC